MLLAAVLLVVGGVWAFVALADAVEENETQRFDSRIINYCRQHPGPPWLQDVGRDLTALGGVTVMTLLTLVVCGYLLISGKARATVLVLVAVIGGLLISSVIKHYVSRDRPPAEFRQAYVFTKSFPSGHSMLSAVTYLTLGGLLAQVTRGRALRVYIVCVALLLTILVGVSRVYLRVHWPTDVLAGWTAGLVWAFGCLFVAHELQRRGTVEEA